MIENEKYICSKCGKQISKEQLFCGNCGTKVKTIKKKNVSVSLTDKHKKIIKAVTIGVSTIAVILIVCFYIMPKIVLPEIYLSTANEAYEKQEFDKAFRFYNKLDKDEINETIVQKYRYAQGKMLFEDADYVKAAEAFSNDATYLDSTNCIFDCGMKLLLNKQYDDAVTVFNMIATEESIVCRNYAKGMNAYVNKQYKEAVGLLETVKGKYEGVDELLLQIYYEYGKTLFEIKEYSDAAIQFTKAGNYLDAIQYGQSCTFMLAEEQLKSGNLNKAKELYKKISGNFAYKGVSVSQRISLLDKYSSFVSLCGKWIATKNYIETKNVYRRDGSWDSWYINEVQKTQTIEIRCYLNNDGTMTIKGKVSFLRCTDYSSLSEYCLPSIKTVNFEIKNVTSIPSNYCIADDTTLIYSNGALSIKYSVRDDYSSYFYNLYNSDITYGSKTESY